MTAKVAVIATSDIHGNILPFNFITSRPGAGSLARVASYAGRVRRSLGNDSVMLLDAGDLLQGQPTVYFYNYEATGHPHIAAEALKVLRYDAAAIGNHDIETGHPVYGRWLREAAPIPILAANVVDDSSDAPYFKPYVMVEKKGVRIAVVGLTTPAVPAWLPPALWSGMRFLDMEQTARHLLPAIRHNEHPDIIVGLFHSGADTSADTAGLRENATLSVAREVDGFDIVIFGHDHRPHCSTIVNNQGKTVVCVNPGANGRIVTRADITFDLATRKVKKITGRLVDVAHLPASRSFTRHFSHHSLLVKRYAARRVGNLTKPISSSGALLGPSTMVDLIHRLQLSVTGAEVSFAAPLSLDTEIEAGPVTVAQMFAIYKYENALSVMRLTGSEIRSYLEHSYDGWIAVLKSDESPTPIYNLDSAAGIDYTVDPTKPFGHRVSIDSMSDGKPFNPDNVYNVVLNAYRAHGGGDLVTLGAGIAHSEIARRIVSTTPRDLRHYLIQLIEQTKTLIPRPLGNWKFTTNPLNTD